MTTNLLITGLAVGLALAGNAASVATEAQARGPVPQAARPAADVDELFGRLYPVFVHPRCANCHGIVVEPPGDDNSVTKESHPAAEKDDPERGADCGSCHDASEDIAKAWGLAPPHLRWAGRDADAICAIQASEVRRRNTRAGGNGAGRTGSYLHHLNHDSLITQAWDGKAGGALGPDEKKLPTPLPGRTQFLEDAAKWVNAGAPCRTTGLVTQSETFSSSYGFPIPGGADGRITVNETAKREVIVRRRSDGRISAEVDMSGSQTFVSVIHVQTDRGRCTATSTTTDDWSRSSPRTVDAGLKVSVDKSGYTIAVVVPETKTTTRQTIVEANDCGFPTHNSADTLELTWPEWTIDIECPSTVPDGDVFCLPFEPQVLGAANGLIRRHVANRGEPTPWLIESPAATNRADTGTALPVDVKITWYVVMSK